MKVIALIPVRLESSRLPNKALKEIEGIPAIIHTLKRTLLAKKLDEVYVATDSHKVKEVVESYNGKVIMTSSHHQTGSDRIAQAALNLDADYIINVQGDEALVDPEAIDACVEGMLQTQAPVSLLYTKFNKFNSPSDIKIVLNLKKEIMYFSRTDIPSNTRTKLDHVYKAYHVVAFKKDFLLKYAELEATPLEKIEFNEYLRILENGYKIQAIYVESDAISIDTEDDLNYVRSVMKDDPIYKKYSGDFK